MDKTFAILINNGFNFEFYGTVIAANAKRARSDFLKEHAGAWYAHPDHIRARDESRSRPDSHTSA